MRTASVTSSIACVIIAMALVCSAAQQPGRLTPAGSRMNHVTRAGAPMARVADRGVTQRRAGAPALPLVSGLLPTVGYGSMADWRATLAPGSVLATWTGFLSAPFYDVSAYPVAVATGDFNNDGKLDVVVANQSGNSVSVLVGAGDGTFGLAQNTTVGVEPVAVAVGDFNGDGNLDIISANYGDSSISVLRGKGNGTFWSKQDTLVGLGPYALVVGNFNTTADAYLDVIVADYDNDAVYYLCGKNDGTFDVSDSVGVGGAPCAIIAQDLFNDGVQDFITADRSGSFTYCPINNDGFFGTAAIETVAGEPRGVASRNFFGTGKPGIAIVDYLDDKVCVYEDDSSSFVLQNTIPVMLNPTSIIADDFNKDGKFDLAVANGSDPAAVESSDNTLSILFGLGSGMFATYTNYIVGAYPQGMACADLNKDNNLDLVSANLGDASRSLGGDISVVLGNGNKTSFQAANAYLVGVVDTYLNDVCTGDLNNDGNKDVVVLSYDKNIMGVFKGMGGGLLIYDQNYAVEQDPVSVKLADFNSDNCLDAVVANQVSDNISVLLGNGNCSFQEKVSYPIEAGSNPASLDVGDFSGDGRPDVVVANYGNNTISLFVSKADGTFDAVRTFPVSGSAVPIWIVAADMNSDQNMDAVVADENGTVHIFIGNGASSFNSDKVTAMALPAGALVKALAVGDIDGNGTLDVACVYQPSATVQGQVCILLGDGAGNLSPLALTPVADYGAHRILLRDLNQDGKQDIVVGNFDASSVSVFLGTGGGNFSQQIIFSAGRCLSGMDMADMDGDTTPDLIAANDSWSGYVSVLLNKSASAIPPAAPTLCVASDGTYPDKVRITFNGSVGATKYQVYRNTQNVPVGAVVISPEITVLQYDDATAEAGTHYFYWVKAGNAAGWSVFSNGDEGWRDNSGNVLTVQAGGSCANAIVQVAPADVAGRANGTTTFTRTYAPGTTVTLTAPTIAQITNVFVKWIVDGADQTTPAIQVTMSSSHTAQAIYQSANVLTVTAGGSCSKVPIQVAPADMSGQGVGMTAFTRVYTPGTQVTLTAPAIAQITNVFMKWTVDGVDQTTPAIQVTMSSSHTAQAIYQSGYLLTMTAGGSVSNVPVHVAPADLSGYSDGTTAFVCVYAPSTVVTVSMPWLPGASNMLDTLTLDGVLQTTTTSTVTMNGNHTVQGTYIPVFVVDVAQWKKRISKKFVTLNTKLITAIMYPYISEDWQMGLKDGDNFSDIFTPQQLTTKNQKQYKYKEKNVVALTYNYNLKKELEKTTVQYWGPSHKRYILYLTP